ncbi:MAG: phenylalanine--tRNA ligase subunit beta [Candidatus Pelagibacter sp. TMED273]|nr:MAG: phenylalanine--tRNA ligase subunit beta [Candidatus Pelagibacter sp. TMED273]|tara:strand:+ start:9670 stop:12030 length:2361 start_codon:yes stop_codon:yes gene_type:complete
MKISRNWLSNFITSSKSDFELVDAFTQLGLECTSSKINSIDSKVIVGKVKSCIKHPNADRLNLCEVDTGSDLLKIVCGAPNVKENILVPVATLGSKIGDFEIKKTKIRGIESNGMICSEKELGISDNHEGIMVLDGAFKIGQTFSEALKLEQDTIFDFDITPNRGDCFSHLGVSRELAIIEGSHINLEKINYKAGEFKSEDLIKIKIDNQSLCPRYSCRIIKNVTVKESPQWLKDKLAVIGQKSINNVVDIANYIMFDLGQPLHAFDYDKLNGKTISVRNAFENEEILCLNNEKNKLDPEDIVISDSKGPVAIAGVIGGFDSQVDFDTKNILLESAIFDEISVRKTSKKYDYAKEASKRFERGVDFENTIYVLDKFTKLLVETTGGQASKDFVDVISKSKDIKSIKFDFNRCNKFLGIDLNQNEYDKLFEKLDIKTSYSKSKFLCTIPSYRNDIDRQVDLYEEIARVYGYNNIPIAQNFNNSYSSIIDNAKQINNDIRSILPSKGFYEHYSNSLYSDKVLKDFNSYETSEIINESSVDMKYMRNSLMPGLLAAVSFNEKRKVNHFKFFEIGRVHSLLKNYNNEEETLGMVWYGHNYNHWRNDCETDIYFAKGEILSILKNLKVNNIHFKVKKSNFSNINIEIYSHKTCIGYLRQLDTKLSKKYDIKDLVVFSEISIDKALKNRIKEFKFKNISPYPSVKRDISILIKKEVSYDEIIECIYKVSDNLLIDTNIFDVYSGEELKNNSKSLAISLIFGSDDKTLIDNDVDKRVNHIIDQLKEKFNIIQR